MLSVVLARDMYEDGYHNLTAIDISDVVIQQMNERDKEYPLIHCIANLELLESRCNDGLL